jgi:hypothetical protein
MFKFNDMRVHAKKEYRKRSPGDIEFLIDSYLKQRMEICNDIDRKIIELKRMLALAKEQGNE